jgi:hypothetical protein
LITEWVSVAHEVIAPTETATTSSATYLEPEAKFNLFLTGFLRSHSVEGPSKINQGHTALGLYFAWNSNLVDLIPSRHKIILFPN